jgi:hypothetical protein
MFLERLKQLELDTLFDYQDDANYQVKMAKRLRQLTFDYLEGKLKNTIPDGPAVKNLRKDLDAIGGMPHFINTQKPNGAWATDIELTLLSELLNVNFVVEYHDRLHPKTKKQLISCLSNVFEPNRSTITLVNTNNTLWDAKVDARKDSRTVHDGNCGYNSFARAIESIARPANRTVKQVTAAEAQHPLKKIKVEATRESTAKIAKTLPVKITNDSKLLEEIALQEQIQAHIRHNEQYKHAINHYSSNDDRQWQTAFSNYSDDQKKQYDQDRLDALRLAIDELPGMAGKKAGSSSYTQRVRR